MTLPIPFLGRAAALAAVLLAAAPALAEQAADAVHPMGAYARAVPPVVKNSAAYLTLHNSADAGHALVGAASPAARVVELHTHSNDDGVMRMRRIERIPLPAGEATRLEPGGHHIMLIDLTGPLEAGGEVELELRFADGSSRTVAAPVRKPGEVGAGHHHHHHDHGSD